MAQAPDYFSDALGPGEQVLAELGGPGPAVERKTGPERVWWQLGVTAGRVLVVKLVQSALTGNYAPQGRWAVGRDFVRIRRFPRTPASAAHLEILGVGEPIHILDIDDPSVFPFVEPFLAAWGGVVEGAGTVKERERDPYDSVQAPVEGIKLMYVAIAVAVILWACCGCSGLAFVVKGWLWPMLE